MRKTLMFVAAGVLLSPSAQAITTNHPVVLELYTSQGCSSCPPADALLKELTAHDPSLIALSFHVHYWDYLGWKDPFSSPDNTARQKGYTKALGQTQMYTPELVVDGASAVVGSNRKAVVAAIAAAKQNKSNINVAITPPDLGNTATVKIWSNEQPLLSHPDIWAVQFNTHAMTNVSAGENSGQMLENDNNVISIRHLGTWDDMREPLTLTTGAMTGDGVAILVQEQDHGHVLAAASYMRQSP